MSTSGTRAGEALPGTRLLLALVIGMGVLIAAGVVVVVATLLSRSLGGRAAAIPTGMAAARVLLDEPAGARIVSVTATGDRLALLIGGGGAPDHVVLLDAHDGAPVATIGLGPEPPAPPR